MQNLFRTWMLPEGVVEALPAEAEKLNQLTQTALDGFARWGYQPLRPPIMEYADTFINHPHSDNLSAQTIQFKDPKSGRQLGLRADMTPQIARLDAHYLSTDKVARYAYAGELVRSYPTGRGSVRNPTVVGAELLGRKSNCPRLLSSWAMSISSCNYCKFWEWMTATIRCFLKLLPTKTVSACNN